MHSFTGVAASRANTNSAFGLFTQNVKKSTRSSHTSSSLCVPSSATTFSTTLFVRIVLIVDASSSASGCSRHAK